MTTQSLKERLRGSGADIALVPSTHGTAGSHNWHQQLQQRWLGQPYRALDSAKRQIRLIKLLPPEGQADAVSLKCLIKTQSLDSTSKYDAISYSWGSAEDPRVINVGGQQIPITKNLHAALTTLQQTNAAKGWLWIDAISINQEDIQERNAQVPLMKDIFSRAETVHVWLGPETSCTTLAIQRLNDIYFGRLRGRAIPEGNEGAAFLSALEGLTQCLWWRRVWVVQEAVLGKAPIAHCGSVALPFINLTQAISTLYTHAMVDSTKGLDATLVSHPQVWNALFDIYRIYNEITAETVKSLIDDDIVDQIGNLAYCDATNPRDYVYGLLGLLPPAVATSITPDYKASIRFIYEDFTVKLMQKTGSLGMLRLCGRQHACSELPSWVPDFRKLCHRGYWGHKAAMGTWHFIKQSKPGELEVGAYMADEVLAVGSSLPQVRLFELLDGDDSKRLRILLQSWRSDRLPYFSMLGDETRPSRISRSRFVEEEPLRLSENAEAAMPHLADKFNAWFTMVTPALIAGVQRDERLSAINTVEQEGFFVTKQGRIGIAYVTPQPGDRVAIMGGCSYAIVVRSCGSEDKYEVVTPCYCDGMMRGEVLREAAQHRFSDDKRVAEVLEKIVLLSTQTLFDASILDGNPFRLDGTIDAKQE
ncbi:hypothetical protein LTR85_008332 [Meristemomyces frigidus]|nr:hypothetical protein LTR85_008332 [Meristemomyces frigidus]